MKTYRVYAPFGFTMSDAEDGGVTMNAIEMMQYILANMLPGPTYPQMVQKIGQYQPKQLIEFLEDNGYTVEPDISQ
jgi:hypothetical protein